MAKVKRTSSLRNVSTEKVGGPAANRARVNRLRATEAMTGKKNKGGPGGTGGQRWYPGSRLA